MISHARPRASAAGLGRGDQLEGTAGLRVHQLVHLHPAPNPLGPEKRFRPAARHDQHPALVRHLHVLDRGMHRERHIRHQRPRRGGPHQKVPARPVQQLQRHPERRILHIPVPQRELVRRQHRLVPRAPRHHLVAAVEEPPVRHLFQQPPHRLHVLGVKRHIRPRIVQPVTDPLREALPFVLVGEDRLLAALVEPGDAALLDLLLVLDAEPFLRLDLDREAVRVPAGDAGDMAAEHGLVAAHQVLDGAADDVVQSGATVGSGRALEEDELLAVAGGLEGAAEGVLLAPGFEDLLLHRDA